MKKLLQQFSADESGAAMVEYTILLGIITIAVIASVIVVGTWVTSKWALLTTNLAGH